MAPACGAIFAGSLDPLPGGLVRVIACTKHDQILGVIERVDESAALVRLVLPHGVVARSWFPIDALRDEWVLRLHAGVGDAIAHTSELDEMLVLAVDTSDIERSLGHA